MSRTKHYRPSSATGERHVKVITPRPSRRRVRQSLAQIRTRADAATFLIDRMGA